jgi:hypothetical protein
VGQADQASDLPDKESEIFLIPGLDIISENQKYPSANCWHRQSERKYNLCLVGIPRIAPVRPSGLTAGCPLLGADRTSSAKGISTRMTRNGHRAIVKIALPGRADDIKLNGGFRCRRIEAALSSLRCRIPDE